MKPDIVVATCKNRYQIAPLMCDLEGFSDGCRVTATCAPTSAAKNRNAGLRWATSDIVIMVDDDMAGFYEGWVQDMIEPFKDPDVYMATANLHNADGSSGPMMFRGDGVADFSTIPRAPTACVAFRRVPGLMFDEGFIGSGFEDDDYCAKLARHFPDGRVVVCNNVRLIHQNEMKNQLGQYYEHNKAHFDSMWRSVRGGTVRIDKHYNIPKILHFVWIGCKMPGWVQCNIDEWRRLNPDFQIMVHDESVLEVWFKKHYARINHPEHALAIKSDLLRLSALLKYGGWYFDADFWPLVPIDTMIQGCAKTASSAEDLYNKLILFASPDKNIVANGALGCIRNAPGLIELVNMVLSQKMDHPEWWDYGTYCTREVLRDKPSLYSMQPLSTIIPFTGKSAALEAMRSPEKIEAAKQNGAWAIHFEMQTTTDIGEDLCTTQSTGRINGSTTTYSSSGETECFSKQEQLTDSLQATLCISNESSDGPDSAPKQTRPRTKTSKKTGTAKQSIAQCGSNQTA